MQFHFLQDILVIVSFSVLVVLAFQRLRLPSILGFLATGILIGPTGLGLVYNTHEVELLAEVGVILLLFVIGLELNLKQLLAIRRTVFVGGTIQVGLTVACTFAVLFLFGYTWAEAIFVGFLFSLSSTAVVLRILQEKNEIHAPHGRIALGILIFQDIVVVPMMLITPIMAGNSVNVLAETGLLLLKTLGVFVMTYISAKYLLPALFYHVVKTRNKELFLLNTIAICLAVAFLTSYAGLSLALGAFLAGLIISESEYSHQATSNIIPFRELFTSFFFVSIGMLLDIKFLLHNFVVIVAIAILVIIVKAVIAGFAAKLLRFPARIVILSGLALLQVGEFSFILSKVGISNGLLSNNSNQYFLSIAIITMGFTPFVLVNSEKIFQFLIRLPIIKHIYQHKNIETSKPDTPDDIENHLLIIGYGLNGTNLAKAAKYANIPTIIIELNFQSVLEGKGKGERMIYGDATQEHILREAFLETARVAVIAISDPQATKTIVANIRSLSKTVYLIVRTRFVKEIDEIINLGADEVIPEEFETSIEIFARALRRFFIPIDYLTKLIQDVRADNYDILLSKQQVRPLANLPDLPDFSIECLRVMADSGTISGNTIAGANIRKTFGINILAITRSGKTISNISPEQQILQNDILYVSGNVKQIAAFYEEIA